MHQPGFRYRGYIYDEETQLYYLNSRDYDPEMGRFINADGYVSTGQGILGYNMFAYCLNNPVNYNDNKGTTAEILQGWESIVIILPLIDGPLPIGDIIAVGGIIIFGVIVYSETEQELPNQGSVSEVPDIPDVSYPGDDPTLASEGTEWRGNGEQGSNQGNYYNGKTGESWHPDLGHPEPIGPHWDYKDSTGKWWRVGKDRITLKE